MQSLHDLGYASSQLQADSVKGVMQRLKRNVMLDAFERMYLCSCHENGSPMNDPSTYRTDSLSQAAFCCVQSCRKINVDFLYAENVVFLVHTCSFIVLSEEYTLKWAW